jgi:heme iron utilization protein
MAVSNSTGRQVKNFISLHRFGVLSSLSLSQQGFPFGSIVPYDLDQDLNLVIFVARIAEHYQNLSADGRASLTISDWFGAEDPQYYGRATLLAQFREVLEQEAAPIRQSYQTRFPGQIPQEILSSFVFMRGTTKKIRWIGGFARAAWLEGESLALEPFDKIAYQALPLLGELNQHSGEALRNLLRKQSQFKAEGAPIKITALDSSGFSLSIGGAGRRELRVEFKAPIASLEQAKSEIIRLSQE